MSVGVMVVANKGKSLEVQDADVAELANKLGSKVYDIPGVVQQEIDNKKKNGVEIDGE